MEGIIYRYISPSKKIYIGQTIQRDLRAQQHKIRAYNQNYSGYYTPFYCAIRKYGFDSFEYEVLSTIIDDNIEVLQKKLDELEIYYIGYYNSFEKGYNATIGGSGLSGKNHPASKKIAQYDLEGNFITTFDSGAIAARSLNLKEATTILSCCNFKIKSSRGFQWRFIEEDIILIIDPVTPKKKVTIKYFGKDNKTSKKVYQYNLDREFIKEWDSIADIKRELGYDDGSISKACNNKIPYYGKRKCEKFIWSYTPLITSLNK